MSEEEQDAKIVEKKKSKRQQQLDDLASVASTPQGIRVLKRILTEAHVFHTTYTDDARKSAFLEGHRNLALMLVADIAKAAPERLGELLLVAKE